MRVVEFSSLTADQRSACGQVLREAFARVQGAYGGEGEAEREVATFFEDPTRFALAALDGETVVGWVGVLQAYETAWELHPLVVHPRHQRRGLGARLIGALEKQVAARGVLTLFLGADDDFGGTALFGRDLFPNVSSHMASLDADQPHPVTFYRKQGYEVVGLIPDANGRGKPDIIMAKRIG